MATLGLCMIVKNEAHVIERCLESVRLLVDYVLVEDTGSNDGTQKVIRDWLQRTGLSGEVIDEPWRDFGYNRSFALRTLRSRRDIDYALVMDADDTVEYDSAFDPANFKDNLAADLYFVHIEGQGKRSARPQICSNGKEFLYRGVIHEFLDTPDRAMSWGAGTLNSSTAGGIVIISRREGARNLNPHKYRDDAALISKALKSEGDKFLRSRYTFYLANSLWDGGERQRALKVYQQRAEMGFWNQEVFVSHYHAAQLMAELNYSEEEIVGKFLRAFETCPTRAEALHGAARYCRTKERYHQAYLFAKAARDLGVCYPGDSLFLREWMYKYGVLDELSIAAYWTGRYRECFDACATLLEGTDLPEKDRPRVEANAANARARLSS